MFCRYCGATIADGSSSCPECGETWKVAPKKAVSAKDRTTAIGLCALGFVGIAGLQRMYVGKWGIGALYALTGGLFLIGTIYDLYQLLSETFTDCDGFPLYAESSIKENYKRREPRDDTHIAIKIICGTFILIQTLMLFFGTVGAFTFASDAVKVQQVEKQKITAEKEQAKEAEKKRKEEEKKRKEDEKKQRQEVERQREEKISAVREAFSKQMSAYPQYVHSGRAGNSLQIIVKDSWNDMSYVEKKNFLINAARINQESGLSKYISEITVRFQLDGRRLAEYDTSNGVRVYH